jgi:hypothetical protein
MPQTEATCGQCEQPATVILYGMCVHEHYAELPKCGDHAGWILDHSARGTLACGRCLDGPAVHECRIMVSKTEAAHATG